MKKEYAKKFLKDFSPILDTHPNLINFLPLLDVHNNESDRGKILIVCSFLEKQLLEIIEGYLICDKKEKDRLLEGYNAPIATFSSRITLAYLLGVISKAEKEELEILKKIRNYFAHDFQATFGDDKVKHYIEKLIFNVPDSVGVQAVSTSSVAIILKLINRPHYVGKHRLKHREWEY